MNLKKIISKNIYQYSIFYPIYHCLMFQIWLKVQIIFLFVKGYIRYIKITPQKVSSEAQVKNFFIS